MPLIKSLNFVKYGRMATSLWLFYMVVQFLKWDFKKYDATCCHFGPNGELAAKLKELGVLNDKILTFFHGEAGYTNEKKLKRELKTLFEIGDLFLPMSEKEKRNLIKLGCEPGRIIVHHMGVDTGKFKPADPMKQEDVIEIYKKSNLFLAPSVKSRDGDEEGIPVVIMEAMAMGIPVVSTNHAGIPELIKNEHSGYLVPERDVTALQERLEMLIAHSELWANFGKEGRRIVERDYNE